MALVYLARDVRHDRPVALKVLHPDLAHALGPERFQREIRLLAGLQHPHILTVHDSGESAGQLWFTMPYIEGQSLRQRLDRDKQLPVDEAVRIAREAAQALEYAHQHGVVHRDIKPENLLLTQDGNTLVADFGIARTLAAGAERLTETGLAIGTPAYMSPEQASGEQDIGARSDIYSLGAVLYEMLTGEAPFTGATPQAVIAKRFTGEVPSVRRTRPTVPEPLDRAIGRALALVPADRYATAAEFARALAPTESTAAAPALARHGRRTPAALVTLVIGFAIGLGVLFAWRRSGRGDGATGPRMLAVLPFENLGGADDAYFADGVTDEVRGKLSNLAGIQVIARGSSMPYRNSTKSPRAIGGELGVRYLLTGTVRWERHPDGTSRVRVHPELVEVTDGTPTSRWQQAFDASLTDIFQMQSDIAGQVAQALNVALADSSRRELAAQPTQNLAAYDAFLRGDATSNGLLAGDPSTLRKAAAYYEQATALDPSFALAWSHLAQARTRLYLNSIPVPALLAAAREAAERAMVLAPQAAESYAALGSYYSVVGEESRGIAEYQTGLRLAPGNPMLIAAIARAEINAGRFDSAAVHARRAAELDPRSPRAASGYGSALRSLHRLPEAAAALDRALLLAPADLDSRSERVMVELARGDLAAARAILRAAPREVDPTALVAFFGNFQDLYWVLDDAQQRLLLRLTPASFDDTRGVWALVLSQTLWLRGDTARARAYADSAIDAIDAIERQLRTPQAQGDASRAANLQWEALRAVALGIRGSKAEAIREGARAVALVRPMGEGRTDDYIRHQQIRMLILVGEHAAALDRLEPLIRSHYDLTPGWLRIDPNFAPLRGNPRFEKLAAGP